MDFRRNHFAKYDTIRFYFNLNIFFFFFNLSGEIFSFNLSIHLQYIKVKRFI